ncbi:MAG TPA: 3-hydroxybutyryl-CoA dehydrogenase, partial [Caldithrix sp.]|nr:3-hydroxybutyryl-CoA dehydrogenase [Caldithrix sp.]
MAEDKIMDIEILKQNEPGGLDAVDAIKTVAVFGAGVMGRGISQIIASKGMEVILIEKDEKQAKFCFAELEKSIDEEIARWTMTESEKRAIMSRIKISSNYDDAIYGDIVIEAIHENLESKKSILAKLDKICDPETIIITNTSALSITEIASETNRQDKIIGMHFLNPVPKIPLVEIVRGLKTSDETYNFIKSFAETLDKTA